MKEDILFFSTDFVHRLKLPKTLFFLFAFKIWDDLPFLLLAQVSVLARLSEMAGEKN